MEHTRVSPLAGSELRVGMVREPPGSRSVCASACDGRREALDGGRMAGELACAGGVCASARRCDAEDNGLPASKPAAVAGSFADSIVPSDYYQRVKSVGHGPFVERPAN